MDWLAHAVDAVQPQHRPCDVVSTHLRGAEISVSPWSPVIHKKRAIHVAPLLRPPTAVSMEAWLTVHRVDKSNKVAQSSALTHASLQTYARKLVFVR